MNYVNLRYGSASGAALALAGLILAGMALADNVGPISGYYRYTDVIVSGNTVSLTLSLRLFNHGNTDISGATVLLRNWIIPSREYGAFRNVTIAVGMTVQLAGSFQIPQREYQSWQEGRLPSLTIEYVDNSGKMAWKPIKMARSLVP